MGKWKVVPFTDIFVDVTSKATKIPKENYLEQGNFQIIDQGKSDIAGYTNEHSGLFTETPAIVFGDHTRILKYVDKPLFIGADGVKLLKSKVPDVNYRYLYYVLCSVHIENTGYNRHFKWLKKSEIPLPPLDEQKRIAKTLDLASEIVKGYKEQLAEMDKLVQSVFYEMFGDPVTNEKGWISQSLLDFGSCKNGMNFGANENGIEIKYLGVGHFKELSIIDGVENLSTISLMQAPSKEYLLKDEDIIFVRSNGNKNLVGRCVVVYPGDAALTFSGFCIRFRKSSDKLMTIYLLYVLKCASVQRLLVGRGANIQNLNQQILKQLKVPVPPISLQAQFVEIVTEIEAPKTQIQQALTEAETLFNSLMQEYFE